MTTRFVTVFAALALVGATSACSDGTGSENPLAVETRAEPAGIRGPAGAPRRGPAGAPAPGEDPIATIAIESGFDQLVGALGYVDAELDAGLVELFLNGTDQFTVFAPTDRAFENLYTLLTGVLGTPIDEIEDVPAPIVLDVLLYHVTEGRRASNSVVPPVRPRTITSLLGETFAVRANGTIEDGLTGLREDAEVVSADISASNGVIHVIDQVIVPPSVVVTLTE